MPPRCSSPPNYVLQLEVDEDAADAAAAAAAAAAAENDLEDLELSTGWKKGNMLYNTRCWDAHGGGPSRFVVGDTPSCFSLPKQHIKTIWRRGSSRAVPFVSVSSFPAS